MAAMGLRSVVKDFSPTIMVPRNLVLRKHDIHGTLSEPFLNLLTRLLKRLREVQGSEGAQEMLREFEQFEKSSTAVAYKSLLEAGQDLLVLHRLYVSDTLDSLVAEHQCECALVLKYPS